MQATKHVQAIEPHRQTPSHRLSLFVRGRIVILLQQANNPHTSRLRLPFPLSARSFGGRSLAPSPTPASLPARTLAPLPAAASPSPSSRRASPGVPFPSTIAPPLDAEEEEAAASRGREIASGHPPHRRARRRGFLCGLSPAGRRIRRELPGGPALRADDGTLSPD